MLDKNEIRLLLSSVSQASGGHIDFDQVSEHESLFRSGKLDSLTALRLVVELEKQNGFCMNDGFDIERIDTIEKIYECFAETR